jgi:ATP-binding cassette subfamily F protein 3
LLRAVCDNFWLVADGTVADFDGDLEDYQRWVLDRKRTGNAAVPPAPAEPAEGGTFKSRDDKRREAEERQRQAATRKPLTTAITKVEKQMAGIEPQLKLIEAELADSATYAALSADELTAKLKQAGDLRQQLEGLEAQWLELQVQLEALP